jgi:NhaA family Na+:H+ antiporter
MNIARRQKVGGILLFAAAVVAMLWANSPLRESYAAISHIDALKGTAIFLFFMSIGIELRHEITHGSLSKPRQAVVPIFAAIGGMAVPVIIYSIVNIGEPSARGWGVPMSTDIAFALGVLAIAGRWLPKQVRTYVMTVAVVDDSLTILMIAIFFASSFHTLSLASLGGVLVGLLVPAAKKLQKQLDPAVAYVILPLFALLSAGVDLSKLATATNASPLITVGIILAMMIGKPLGVLGTTWIVTKSKLGTLPQQVTWPRLRRVGLLFGMCFTVAMLMSELSFGDSEGEHSLANVSVLIASAAMAMLATAALSIRTKHLHEH